MKSWTANNHRSMKCICSDQNHHMILVSVEIEYKLIIMLFFNVRFFYPIQNFSNKIKSLFKYLYKICQQNNQTCLFM